MKGQLSLEFLIILIVMLLLFSNVSLDLIDDSLADAEAFSAAEMIKSANSSLYTTAATLALQGPGAKRTLYLRAPSGCSYNVGTSKVIVQCSSTSPASKYNLMQIGPELTGANYAITTVQGGLVGSVTLTLAGAVEGGGGAGGGGGGGGGGENQAPTVKLSFSCENLFCEFDSTGSSDSDGYIANNEWDFGDSATDVGISTTHNYAKAGSYTVKFTATDDDGAKTSKEAAVQVVADGSVNQKPIAVIKNKDTGGDIGGKTVEVLPDERIHLDGTGSYDPDGSVASYSWDFGTTEEESEDDTSEDSQPTYWYDSIGTYTVTLTVTDDKGAKTEATTTVEVTETAGYAPVILSAPDAEGDRKSQIELSCKAKDSDGKIAKYEWDFEGDGTYESSFSTDAEEDTASHAYSTTGTHTAKVRVTDSAGKTATADIKVTVRPVFEDTNAGINPYNLWPSYWRIIASPDGKHVILKAKYYLHVSHDSGSTWSPVMVKADYSWDSKKTTIQAYDLAFVDNNNAVAVGYAQTVFKSSTGNNLKVGDSWSLTNTPIKTKAGEPDLVSAKDVGFESSNKITLLYDTCSRKRTTDGGSSWSAVSGITTGTGISCDSIACSGTACYVVQTGSGTNIFGSPNPRHIFKVTDGTTAADKGDIYAGLENDTFVTVQADDSNKAWALAGYNGMYYLMPRNYILNSSDGGASWDVTSYGSAKNFHLSSISAYGNTVVAVGQYYVANAEPKCVDGPGGTTGGTRSVILRSLDGGKTWNEISWGPEESQFTYYYMLTSVHLVSENSGWVIGYYPCPDKSKGEKNWVYTGILLKYS